MGAESFSDSIAASAELQMVDANFEARPGIEQLFLSVVLPNSPSTIFTAGKFNSPFGVERRDFWDRLTGSTSLLFEAQPQNLTGIMVTHSLCDTGVILRPMVVNGWDDNLDVNEQPSLALMAQYQPSSDVTLAATNWWGPEFPGRVGDKLHLFDAQAVWHVQPKFIVSGEFLHGRTQSPAGELDWHGFLALASHDVSEQYRVFAQWSLLDDSDAYLTGMAERRQEFNAGGSWYLHPHVEMRMEYRHDYYGSLGDFDHWDAHFTFGF